MTRIQITQKRVVDETVPSTITPTDQPSTALFVVENHHNLLDNLS